MKFVSFKKGHLTGHRAFTLIELLVVIAIIGILSSVVLASLNTARNKGADAAVKSNLANARAEAELYYDSNNNSYGTTGSGTALANVCSATAANGIGDNVNAAASAGGGAGACVVIANGWAASSPLKTSGFYCVDSTGVATSTTANNSDGTCL